MALVGFAWGAGPARAAEPAGSTAVVQPLPPSQVGDLNGALRRLAINPQDVAALIDAGHASLALDDVDAAAGFFSRAENLAPGDPRAKAGLAAAYVRSENPYDAILLFEQAQKSGASLNDVAADLGLAYDLVGANEQAQAYYRTALSRGPDPEVSRRLAISRAIVGDRNGVEAALLPLLEGRDLAAYRARAFALAILGDAKSSLEIVNAVMPSEMARKLVPYMRYMPRLTAAQQAAAANFGHFPRTADIGRDDPRVARYQGKAVSPRGSDVALVPAGEPLGTGTVAQVTPSKSKKKDKPKKRGTEALAGSAAGPGAPPPPRLASRDAAPVARIERVETPEPQPAAVPAPAPVVSSAPASAPVARPSLSIAAPATPAPAPQTVAQPVSQPPAAAPVPSFDLAGLAGSRASQPEPALPALATAPPSAPAAMPVARVEVTPPVVPQVPETRMPQTAPEPAPAPEQTLSVADAFADLALPSAPARKVSAGAVDITRIKPKREEPPAPKVEEKPRPPAHPSRAWVQLATGRDLKALGFDWRRFSRHAPVSLKGRKPYVTPWGQANRLLTGPFDNPAAASAMVKKLKEEGVDSFTFTSDDGQEISPLSAGK